MDVTKGNKLPTVCPDIPGDGVFILIYLASPFKTIIKIPKNKNRKDFLLSLISHLFNYPSLQISLPHSRK